MSLTCKYKSLVESLRLLASTEEEQRKYLPDFVVVQDEVVSPFGDAFLLSPQLIENDLLSNKAIGALVRCYNFVEMTLRNSENLESFRNQESWNKVRKLARQTLYEMGEELKEPDLSFIIWVN